VKRFINVSRLFVFAIVSIIACASERSVIITAPEPGSSFLSPSSVSISGEVTIPEGEWFELRVFRMERSDRYYSRKEPVHVATLKTNRFNLVLTNLATGNYDYSFILNTLDAGSVASNHLTFSLTNFPFRLGPYSVTDLGTLGGTQTMAFAINNLGQAIGKSRNTSDKDRAVLFEHGTVRDLGTLGGAASHALAINNLGHIVGSAETAVGLSVPFLYRTNQMENLGITEAGDALGINDRGDIVGVTAETGFAILDSVKSNLGFRPFAINNRRNAVGSAPDYTGTQNPVIRDLEIHPPFIDDPNENGFISAQVYGGGGAYAINDARQFTGLIEDGNYRQYRVGAPLYSEGVLQNLTSGYTAYAVGLGINRWGEVVGSYLPRWTGYYLGHPTSDPPLPSELKDKEALIANPAGVTNLNALIPATSGWRLLEATDINDAGQIVGYGLKDGQIRAFRLDPLLTISKLEPTSTGAAAIVQATPGATVRVEASENFKDWRVISTQSANGYLIPFKDESPANAAFYRASILNSEREP
jgi:probable HAF family extracellular repeat protein